MEAVRRENQTNQRTKRNMGDRAMSNRHECIKWEVISDWTKQNRGRLYCMNQGLAIPWAEYDRAVQEAKRGFFKKILSLIPRWFGPLKRKFKGFPDTFGFEFVNGLPIFCVVEIKTRNDSLSKHQRRVMGWLNSVGVRCYVAKENQNDNGYTIKRWNG